jgi:hypothetical protein
VGNSNFINLDYTLINATTNTPLVSTSTRIKRANGSYGYGITNNAGFVSGLVPNNEALVLEVFASNGCNTILFSQNIGPFAVNTSLGNIAVTISAAQSITFTGTLLNCSATAVTNGYVSLATTGGNGAFGNTSVTGTFSFSIINCSGSSLSYNYKGIDITTNQQSTEFNGNALNGTVNLGNIFTCAATTFADIYVAGVESGVAKVWKNGLATNLSNSIYSYAANSVFVSGNDIYVAGVDGNFAKYWKNGVGTNLSTGGNMGASAESIFVLGSDVYVTGYEKLYSQNFMQTNYVKVWKNGIAIDLGASIYRASGSSIYVAGSDVYVAGYVSSGVGTSAGDGKVWKNGVVSNLTPIFANNANNRYNWGQATSVFVNGSDVYVAVNEGGYFNSLSSNLTLAKVWKNGIATNLTSDSTNTIANSIFVSGIDVYVAGAQMNTAGIYVAKVWKNGIATSLSDGIVNTYATSVAIKGTDVYVLTNQYDNNGNSFNTKVFKNGFLTNFFSATNNINARSLFVK